MQGPIWFPLLTQRKSRVAPSRRSLTVPGTDCVLHIHVHEAGSKISLTYTLNSGVSTTGMYVGLWLAIDHPISHVVDPDHTTGYPLSAAFLPVGISGAGVIQLDTPITAAAGNYIVYSFNNNIGTPSGEPSGQPSG